jgi:hypothetical protein
MVGKVKTPAEILAEQEKQAEAERAGNTMTKMGSTTLTGDADNPWLEFEGVLNQYIGAPYVKFTQHGTWALNEYDELPTKCRAVVRVDECVTGWKCWQNSKPVESREGRIADRFVVPRRSELGRLDQRVWEKRDDGTAQDPWVLSMTLPVIRCDTSQTLLYSTSSKGGMSAVNTLILVYGARVRDNGKTAGYPICELAASSYRHQRYGKIFVPLLPVCGWTDASGKPLSLKAELDDEVPA